jgi:hypothetical protein
MSTLLNLTAFQALWLVIVTSAARGAEWIGLLALALWLPMHLQLSRHSRSDAALFAAFALLGPLLETVAQQARLIEFRGYALHPALAPVWLAALWGNFALTVNHGLRPLLRRPGLAVALGAIGGPLAYLAGARLGAAELASPAWQALAPLALAWALVMGLLCRTRGRGHAPALLAP